MVSISRTRLMENAIFFGNKAETISDMNWILKHQTHWCDFIDEVIDMITINSVVEHSPLRVINQAHLPFRVCDISVPQD